MRKQALGPLPYHMYDKEDVLYDWVADCNQGVMGFEFGDVPEECFEFCMSQYERFRIPFPNDMGEVLTTGASATLYYIDCVDPYALFCQGMSDVEITTEWSECTYVITDGARVYEADPSNIETFRLVPGQDERGFIDIMSKPSLEALPGSLGWGIGDILSGEYGSDRYYSLSPSSEEILRSLCRKPDGSLNGEMMDAYFDLAAWAACAWIFGPLARAFRYKFHDIFNVAMDYGEAILLDGSVLNPKYYKKIPRPPKSCSKCNLSSWCVEMVSSHMGTRYLCEHCLSDGMPPSELSTCGSKRCLLAECPHHPYHNLGTSGIYQARRDFGQLGASARGDSALRIKGGVNGSSQ